MDVIEYKSNIRFWAKGFFHHAIRKLTHLLTLPRRWILFVGGVASGMVFMQPTEQACYFMGSQLFIELYLCVRFNSEALDNENYTIIKHNPKSQPSECGQ